MKKAAQYKVENGSKIMMFDNLKDARAWKRLEKCGLPEDAIVQIYKYEENGGFELWVPTR